MHTFRSLSLALVGMILILACTGCSTLKELAPTSKDTSHITEWVAIPIFYRTNRAKKPDSGPFSFVEELSPDGRVFGVKNIVVPMPWHDPISKEMMDKLGWQAIHLEHGMGSNEVPAIPGKTALADRELSDKEIVPTFNEYRQKSGTQNALIFAHGCCANFDTSIERAAKVAAVTQEPVVLYDWVSPVGFVHYLKNETLVQQELDDFNKFLINLGKVIPASSTTLMGHSMGAMFLDNGLVRRCERGCQGSESEQYREVIFSNPDTDARSYLNHQELVKKNAKIVRVFFSPTDGRLKNSSTAHGGYPRLGRPETLLPDLCKLDGQDFIDVTSFGFGHEVPFTIVGDIHRTGKVSPDCGYTLSQDGAHLYTLHKAVASARERRLPAGNDLSFNQFHAHHEQCRCP